MNVSGGGLPELHEDQVNDDVSAGLRQDFFRPSKAKHSLMRTQGLRPGLHSGAASRLFDCDPLYGRTHVMIVTLLV
jgi:hypothetical protein